MMDMSEIRNDFVGNLKFKSKINKLASVELFISANIFCPVSNVQNASMWSNPKFELKKHAADANQK